ncbi:Phage integrase family protein, partial [Haemophilus influenzae]
KQRRVMI